MLFASSHFSCVSYSFIGTRFESLEELGYAFNKEDKLRKLIDGQLTDQPVK